METANLIANENNFTENVTFTDLKDLKADDFEETLAFVKDCLSTLNTQNETQHIDKPLSQSIVQRLTPCLRDSLRVSINSQEIQPSNSKTCSGNNNLDSTICSKQRDLRSWGLPPEIVSKYASKGVNHMFQWQVECLGNSKVLNESGNLVYSAPTSAGKTLVAEILTIKTVLERQKKVLIILPFVSVVREKMFYFQDIFSKSGIRVEGFMGSQSPPGGFQSVHVAICTIEKANNLVNSLLENGTVSELGAVVVDELHLLGDPHRGYILELLLTKLLYVTRRYEQVHIQIIGMSATLPNLSLLSEWLNAGLYKTDFRPIPLKEQYHFDSCIYDSEKQLTRKIETSDELANDKENIIFLCLETIIDKCSILIFCPTKNWCENLAQQIAVSFKTLGYANTHYGKYLREQLDGSAISEVLEQLKSSPAGLDNVLYQTISFGVAFHHAGLTMDERDIIEGAFKRNTIRVLISTSTLSSGVNLPARRVIIRSPTFYSKPINIQTYKQMVGRAGRMGIDTAGESILMCNMNDRKIAENLISGTFEPIASCLEGGDKLMRAVLESIASQVANTPEEVQLFINCTLLLNSLSDSDSMRSYADETIKELVDYELVRLQNTNDELIYTATPLGKACLSSSMSPQDGLILFKELQKARECFVLETDLHMIYLVTPYSICYQWGEINWMHLLSLWDGLSKSMKRVGEMVGIQESLIYRCVRGGVKMNTPSLQNKLKIIKRFYTALALQDLINEIPLSVVASNFDCSRGMLQSLQQSAATFAGMVTAFSRQLGWKNFETLVSQFQDRLQFGIQSELLDLMRLQSLNGLRARALFNSGTESICQLAVANVCIIENALHSALPFQSEKERDGEGKYDVEKRNMMKYIWITGKKGVTAREAAELLIMEARTYLQYEMGVTEVKWQKCPNKLDTFSTQEVSTVNQNITNVEPTIDITTEVCPQHNIHSMETLLLEATSNMMSSHNEALQMQSINNSTPNTDKNLQSLISEQPDDRISVDVPNAHALQTVETDSLNFLSIDEDVIIENLTPNNTSKTNEVIHNDPSIDCGNISYKSNCSLFQSDHSKDLSMFEDSLEMDTQLCKLLDKNHTRLSNDQMNKVDRNLTRLSDEKMDKEDRSYTRVLNDKMNKVETEKIPSIQAEDLTERFTCNMLSIENVFALPFEDSLKVQTQDTNSNEPRRSLDDVIMSSQETSCMENSLINTKIATPKRKLKRREPKRIKKQKCSQEIFDDDNILSQDFICPSPLKLKKNFNHKNIIQSQSDKSAFTDRLKKGDYKKIKLPSSVSRNKVLYIVKVCSNPGSWTEYCSHILQSKTLAIFIDLELEKNGPVSKIGCNILKNKNLQNQNISEKTSNLYNGKFIRGFSIFVEKDVAFYFTLQLKLFSAKVIQFLNDIFADKEKSIIMYGCKFNFLALMNCLNLKINCLWEDPLVADWLIDPECDIKSLSNVVETYCHVDFKSILNDKEIEENACLNAWGSFYCLKSLKAVIRQKHAGLIQTFGIEMKALRVIAECEASGIEVDKHMAGATLNRVQIAQEVLEKHAFKITGRRFRLSSPSEVAKILGLYNGRKVSTSKKALEKIDNPLAQIVIYWRKLSAILSKNLFPLTAKATEDSKNSRIYGSYWTHTSTGRMSMQEPNLQSVPRNFQIPVELLQIGSGENFDNLTFFSCRSIFPSAPSTVLVSADYCQLELRLLTHLSCDATLRKIVMSDGDIFKAIAATWKCITEEEVEDDLRQKAKQMCYGIIYGMGPKTLAQTLDICELEAVVFMNSFHAAYPSIRVYIDMVVESCKKHGYVETFSGRRRYLPLINSSNYSEKSHAERQAVNTTIQGSAADILKSAMTLTHEKLSETFHSDSSEIKLVLLLHDELMYEVPLDKVDRFTSILRLCMETTVTLSVPLPVKVKIGKLWGEMKEVS